MDIGIVLNKLGENDINYEGVVHITNNKPHLKKLKITLKHRDSNHDSI